MTSGIFDCLFVYDAAQDLLAQPNDLLVLLPHGIGAGDRAVGSQHNGIGSHHMGHGGSGLEDALGGGHALAAQGFRGLQGSGQCFQLVRRQIAGNQNILRLGARLRMV